MMNYLVSVIIPVYNTEQYLRTCLDSVVKQSIDGITHEQCIQLIIINDGSTDRSEEIILDYKEKFSNILYLRQENAGQAMARNRGIQLSQGKYLYFLDSDDMLMDKGLERLYQKAERLQSDIIVAMAKGFNSKRVWYLDFITAAACANYINVPLEEAPTLIRSANPWAKLYLRSLIVAHQIQFPTHLKLGEDWCFVITALKQASKISCFPAVVCGYRGREGGEKSESSIINERAFYDLIQAYQYVASQLSHEQHIREAKIHVLNSILHRFYAYSNQHDFQGVDRLYRALTRFLNDDIGHEFFVIFTLERRLTLCYLSRSCYLEAYHLAHKQIMSLQFDEVQDLYPEAQTLLLRKYRKPRTLIIKRVSKWCQKKWSMIKWQGQYYFAYFLSKLMMLSKQDIVLIGEKRGESANDTGYFLYKKVIEANLPTNKTYYFVVKKKKTTLSRTRGLPNVIWYGSFKHFWIFCLANTYVYSDSIKDVLLKWPLVSHQHAHKLKVFLQHGVFGFSRTRAYYDRKSMLLRHELPNIFIVSSEYEKELVKDNFDFLEDELYVTGLSRWDTLPQVNTHLESKKSRTILCLFTWREWLTNCNENVFLNSDYYQAIDQFLNDSRLSDLLTANDANIVLCLHQKMHKMFSMITLPQSISVVSLQDCDMQSLLINSDLLITDYSSVSFDMLYQNKPVIYYWFDHERFLVVRGGIMILESDDIPGSIVYSNDELLHVLDSYLMNGCCLLDSHIQAVNRFFTYKDGRNCERIISLIEASSVMNK